MKGRCCWSLLFSSLHSFVILFFSKSYLKWLIITLLKQLNTNVQGILIFLLKAVYLDACNISFHHIGETTKYLEVLASQMTNCFMCDAQTPLHISKSFSSKHLCILFQLPSNFNLVEHFQSDNKLLVQRAKWNSSFFQALSDVYSDKEQLFLWIRYAEKLLNCMKKLFGLSFLHDLFYTHWLHCWHCEVLFIFFLMVC